MSTIEKSIDVAAPLSTVYDQWTQFETFPEFMQGVESVQQLDDTHLHWKAEVLGVRREWDAEIVDQTPDERITWRSTDGTTNAGTVSFAPAAAGGTRVTLHLEIEPEGIVEKVGDALHIVDRRATGDLERFREFIEARGSETGGWRGDVSPGGASGSTPGGAPGGAAAVDVPPPVI